MATVNFTGKWMEDHADNKEAMLKKLGMPEEQAAQMVAFNMGIDIMHEGDNFTMTMLTPDGKEICVNKFSIGVPMTPTVPAGAIPMHEMVMSYVEGGKALRAKATGDNDYIDDTYLEPNGDMKVVQKAGDVTCTTIYKKM
ncbi:fatty acid-binding protein 2, liver-like [Amphiura filiformis]|uniref:fatty acid-binding protein 2, liver-like n=1 Tax=Amphiura filiformis TaxID=82378 RepID=UPI003B222772